MLLQSLRAPYLASGGPGSIWNYLGVVLATVPGYPAAVRVWNWTGSSTPGCYPENRGTHRVWGQVGTGLRFHITVPSTLAPIKYLSSDRIVT